MGAQVEPEARRPPLTFKALLSTLGSIIAVDALGSYCQG